MKKLFVFASAMMAALTMNAQTAIMVDGDASDWAEIPMVTEPGTMPLLKFSVNAGEGNAFAVLLDQDSTISNVDFPAFYIDADKDASTGTNPWTIPSLGYEYEFGAWKGTAIINGSIYEATYPVSAFTTSPFIGSLHTQMTYNWGAYYLPSSPSETKTSEGWDSWGADMHHPYCVEANTYVNLNGTHAAADTKFTHKALAWGNVFNFAVSGGNQDTAFWAAWPVEFTYPGVYSISAVVTSTDNVSCDLYLVDVATNQVVASKKSENIWQPTGETAFGNWDLSAVPTGKYMLKVMNHVPWSHMQLTSVTLTNPDMPTSDEQIQAVEAAPVKMIRNGRFMINNNGKFINALGF